MVLTVKFTFHLFAFAIDFSGVFYDYFKLDVGHEGFGGKFKHLTFWCIILQTIYFGLNVIVDLTEKVPNPTNASQRNGLQKFRDTFHAGIAFPIAVFVAFTFWGLYAVDRELVYPKVLDTLIPPWLNHLVHTAIIPLIIIDKALSRHYYPQRLHGLLWTICLSLSYLAWILLIAYVDDFWVYPILKVLKAHERGIFIGLCLVIFILFYFLGEYMTKYFWGNSKRTTKAQKTVHAKKIHKNRS